jgi:hypothetical protein
MEKQLDTDWEKVARKLARWLPMDGIVYVRTYFRADMPTELLTGQMTPEDWMAAARKAAERAK